MSYSVAADWKLAMCPPSSEDSLLARSTIATAFHRIIDRIRCSIAPSPGCAGCWSGGIVFRYGVFAEYGTGAPLRRASPISSSSRNPARSAPSNSMHRVERFPPLAGLDRIQVLRHLSSSTIALDGCLSWCRLTPVHTAPTKSLRRKQSAARDSVARQWMCEPPLTS